MHSVRFGQIYIFKTHPSQWYQAEDIEQLITKNKGLPTQRHGCSQPDIHNVVVSGQDCMNYIADKAKAKQKDFLFPAKDGYANQAELDNNTKYAGMKTDAAGDPVVVIQSTEDYKRIRNQIIG